MAKENEIICIICPLACRVTVNIDEEGTILGATNYLCKEGENYAIAEYKFPGRILTTTILTEDSSCKLLPVRTSGPVPKERLKEMMYFLSRIKVKPPVKMGQVILPNVLNTGVDLVSTDDLKKLKTG